MNRTPISRTVLAVIILLSVAVFAPGCASSGPTSETPAQQAAPATTERTHSK